ncbi:hypothetical protein Q3G72_029183 [Acer saccharum]|nr:hypothetical protein Q3G72_029183 [Acer saccharum]
MCMEASLGGVSRAFSWGVMPVPVQVTASSGINSSLITAVKPGVNSLLLPTENLVLRPTLRTAVSSDLVSSSGPIVSVVFNDSDSTLSVGMASAALGLEAMVVSPFVGIDSILVPNSFSGVLSSLDVPSSVGSIVSSLLDAHDLGGARDHVAHLIASLILSNPSSHLGASIWRDVRAHQVIMDNLVLQLASVARINQRVLRDGSNPSEASLVATNVVVLV